MMRSLTVFIDFVDRFSTRLGHIASWAVVLACAVSAVKVFFGAPAILRLNEHVRVT